MIDIYNIFTEVIAFILGSIISLGVSWYFYKKADFSSKVTDSVTSDILFLMIESNIDTEFSFYYEVDKSELPQDLRVPHILNYWLSSQQIKMREDITLLFRVQDKDFDFQGEEYIEVMELESNVSFSSKRKGHGFYLCRIACPTGATPGWHKLKITLTDSKKNTHSQFIKFQVE